MDTQLENEVAKRFGVLPNFFRLSAADPKRQVAISLFDAFVSKIAN